MSQGFGVISKASVETGSEGFLAEFVCAFWCFKLSLSICRGFELTACLYMVNLKTEFDFNNGVDSTETLNLKPCK